MVLYNCYCCNYSSKLKGDYNRHLKTKKHLRHQSTSVIPMVVTTNDHKMTTNDHKMTTNDHKMTTNDHKMTTKKHKYSCDFCDSTFSTKPHKRRHELHFCKENNSIMSEKIYNLEKEKKKLEKEIVKLIDKVGNVTNNNTNNIIVVNNYGKENTDYLTIDKIKKLLNRPYDSVQELIKMLHYDPDHPENHNIKITNKKEPYALVWNDSIWELRKKKSVVKDLVDKGYMMIDGTHDTIDETNNKYIKFQDNFEDNASNIKDKIEAETEIVIINETKKLDSINII
jgi:hypothetical protein